MTVFEVAFPLFFAGLLLMIRALADSKYISYDSTWGREYPKQMNKPVSKSVLFFTPNNSFTREIMTDVGNATDAQGEF